jgi:hypothetical protein
MDRVSPVIGLPDHLNIGVRSEQAPEKCSRRGLVIRD